MVTIAMPFVVKYVHVFFLFADGDLTILFGYRVLDNAGYNLIMRSFKSL